MTERVLSQARQEEPQCFAHISSASQPGKRGVGTCNGLQAAVPSINDLFCTVTYVVGRFKKLYLSNLRPWLSSDRRCRACPAAKLSPAHITSLVTPPSPALVPALLSPGHPHHNRRQLGVLHILHRARDVFYHRHRYQHPPCLFKPLTRRCSSLGLSSLTMLFYSP